MNKFYSGMADILEVEVSDVTLGFKLEDGGAKWDSLAIVSTIALIDELYDKTVDGQRLFECKTISDIENLINSA